LIRSCGIATTIGGAKSTPTRKTFATFLTLRRDINPDRVRCLPVGAAKQTQQSVGHPPAGRDRAEGEEVMLSSDMIAFDYLQRAEEFYQAFKDLRPRPPVNWPRYFVLCHSIELALKAFLLRSGIQPDDLRKHPIRHDIEALIREAEKYSLPLAQSAKDGLILLSRAHATPISRRFLWRWARFYRRPV
jgi:hypothetical protein